MILVVILISFTNIYCLPLSSSSEEFHHNNGFKYQVEDTVENKEEQNLNELKKQIIEYFLKQRLNNFTKRPVYEGSSEDSDETSFKRDLLAEYLKAKKGNHKDSVLKRGMKTVALGFGK